MSIKIETYGSLLVGAVVIWYLARRTNLGGAFTKDVMSVPQRLTGYFSGSQTTRTPYYAGRTPLEVESYNGIRRRYTRPFQSM